MEVDDHVYNIPINDNLKHQSEEKYGKVDCEKKYVLNYKHNFCLKVRNYEPLNVEIDKIVEKKNNQKDYVYIGNIVQAIPEI